MGNRASVAREPLFGEVVWQAALAADIKSLSISPDSRFIAACSAGELRISDARIGTTLLTEPCDLSGVEWSNDCKGRRLLVSTGRKVQLVELSKDGCAVVSQTQLDDAH